MLILSGCGGDNGDSCLSDGSCYQVGGVLDGLLPSSSLVVQNDGADNLTLTANGSFLFSNPVDNSSDYNVTVLTQPTGQTCSIIDNDGYGPGPGDDNVAISCTPNSYTISGTVAGLTPGNVLILQNNGADTVTLAGNGGFSFGTSVSYSRSYSVTVLSQPHAPVQNCTVANAAGAVAGLVTNIVVTCI
ncbi:hypothetical protein BGC_41120 [Burkholderia sp. 3C]